MESLMEFMTYKTTGLTVFFQLISLLAEEYFIMTFLAIGYWCLDKKFYRDLTVLVCISTMLNVLLKATFKVPRPMVEQLIFVNDLYSFPSGHAQITAVFWLMLAIHYKKAFLWWLTSLIILGQCVSRIYLGVHLPADVFVGTMIGMITVVFYTMYRKSDFWALFSRSKGAMTLVFSGFIGVYWFCMLDNLNINTIVAMGALIGVIVGHLLENYFCFYQNPVDNKSKFLIATVGMIMLLTMQFVLQSVLPVRQSLLYLFAMYAILGLQITYLFPVLVKLCLKKKVHKQCIDKVI